MVSVNQTFYNKSLDVKCKSLKDLENDIPNKDNAAKYGVPKNTFFIWAEKQRYIISNTGKKVWIPNERAPVAAILKKSTQQFTFVYWQAKPANTTRPYHH